MLSRFLSLAITVLLSASTFAVAEDNQLTAAEKTAGWKLLFDGTTTKGWHAIGKPEFPKKGWTVEGGEIRLPKKAGAGDIVTEELFGDFELLCDWKIEEGTNSGIKYNLPDATKNIGCEYQILDDVNHPDGKLHDGTRTTAGLYDVIAPAANKKLNPPGQWNTTRILVKGNHVEHWLNGTKTVEFDFGSDAFKEAVAGSKFKGMSTWGVKTKSPILLQDHGDPVVFKNIKIRVPLAS